MGSLAEGRWGDDYAVWGWGGRQMLAFGLVHALKGEGVEL